MHDAGVHDEINLARLVRRLDKSAETEEWKNADANEDTFLKAEGVLQRVKFARKLLKNCEKSVDSTDKMHVLLNGWRGKLDHVESFMKGVRDRTRPQPTRLPPILPTLPVPTVASGGVEPVDGPLLEDSYALPIQVEEKQRKETLPLPAEQLLLTPSDSASSFPSTSAIPSLITPNLSLRNSKPSDTAAVATGTSRFLQTSNALQQELSDQLAQMAVQLKRNALHFSDSLVKDKAIVEEAQQKLESNFDVMQKERIRLRDHRAKSSSTTWMVVAIILAAMLLFAFMVILIRLTRTI
ncbi:hypothetical protein M378DRAFT_78470 [Amanita muscaria Koide BX008]|uniref:USE1-like protein n=1 Tax=Amanita muscaria (strain Koide BX008) TaxID=946122 RepID=A0A0C2X4X5_AMAMK|nr:hypothetical protein M378DRAFT_78470 [Amanita muscaria Koide BX008]